MPTNPDQKFQTLPTESPHLIHRLFEIGIFLKGLDGILEIIGGILLFTVKPQFISHIVALLTQSELSEDPKDKIANLLLKSAHNLSLGSQYYGGLFLLSHGLIKIILIIALFKRKLWAYPTAVVVFTLFIIYQLYRYTLTHSIWMIILSVLDGFVIVLTYMEYQNLKSQSKSL